MKTRQCLILLSGTHTKVNHVLDKAKLMEITMRNSLRLAQIMKKRFLNMPVMMEKQEDSQD